MWTRKPTLSKYYSIDDNDKVVMIQSHSRPLALLPSSTITGSSGSMSGQRTPEQHYNMLLDTFQQIYSPKVRPNFRGKDRIDEDNDNDNDDDDGCGGDCPF